MARERPLKRLRTSSEPAMEKKSYERPPHFGFLEGRCINCGRLRKEGDVEDGSAFVPLDYLHETLTLSQKSIDENRRMKLRSLVGEKKLVLVLDLDHTLLHTTSLDLLTDDEEYLLTSPPGGVDDELYRIDHMGFITKLRPFVRTFLDEASDLFELYVYTMGSRSYAREIAKILDTGSTLFGSRVISKEDCTCRGQKGLDVVLADERLVVILDDTEKVWSRHQGNLIRMQGYDFFASRCHGFKSEGKSFAEMRMDERGCGGGLLCNILDVLRRVHAAVFDEELGVDLSSRDVPHVLERMQRVVLAECSIVFPEMFFSEWEDEIDPAWRMAQRLGAKCSVERDDSATHVVATSGHAPNARWAVQQEKPVVTPDWIEAAYFLWKRPSEKDFALPPPSSAVLAAAGCGTSIVAPPVLGPQCVV